MDAMASTMQHSYNQGPRGPSLPHGAQQAQGLHQPATGPSGAPHPEEQHQQHHKPFFYVQPSQPYHPMQNMQWPVPVPIPVSYNPYYGYPGLGYGMPVMPNYQSNPYMEQPGFVVPHTHLHLMDYRRMLNPQYYQTMAYHSRRFRYQHNGQTREMINSEVQTEPLCTNQRTSTPDSSNTEAFHAPCQSSNISPTVPIVKPLVPALAVQKGDTSLEVKVPPSTCRTPSNDSFVIQTEEVRIECCTTPVGLQLLHAHKTAEVSHSFSHDMVQCGSILQGRMLQDTGPGLPADPSEQAVQACPDILLVGTPSSSEKIFVLEESSRNQADHVTVSSNIGSEETSHGDAQKTSEEKDWTDSNLQCRIVHLPFDPRYLDELRKMESTVWSMEETLIPSPESLIQNDHTMLTVVGDGSLADVLTVGEEAPAEEAIPIIEVLPLIADELEEMSEDIVDDPGKEEVLSKADIFSMTDVTVVCEPPMSELTQNAEVDHAPYLPSLANSPLKPDRHQLRSELNVQDHQDTSFESLPAYLPSSSWLADYDNVYYCNKLPPTPKKQNRPLNRTLEVPSRRRKLELEYKDPPTTRKPKERYKPKGKVDRRSLSDHECCISTNFSENMCTSNASKRDRLCTRCLAKRRVCTSISPELGGRTIKRKPVPFQQRNDALLSTCETCQSQSKKQLMRKGSSPGVRCRHHGHDTEGESSENGSCRTGPNWRATNEPRMLNDLKRPLASKQNVVTCHAAMYQKLRERNSLSNEAQHQSVAWERLCHCPHSNAIREMDENCMSLQDKWRNMDQIYLTHRWQTEKSWKAVIPKHDPDGSKTEARLHHLTKRKNLNPQSQGTHRKDTRC